MILQRKYTQPVSLPKAALAFFLSPLLILQISHEQMSGFPFLRKMAHQDEVTTDVTVSSFCTYFVCISEERWVLSTWTIYLLNLFSLSYSSILFLLGSFCLQNANIFMFQSHFLTWFTHGAFHLSFLWHWTWSGPVQWLFPVPLSLSILQIRSDQLPQSCPTLCDPTDGSPPDSPVPWTEEPGGLRSIGSQRIGHNTSNLAYTYASCL